VVRPAVRWLLLLTLVGCTAVTPTVPTPVKLITADNPAGWCSAVQLDDCTFVTAAHCFHTGAPGVALVKVGDDVEAEGYGCNAVRDGWKLKTESMRRRAKITAINRMLVGFEIELSVPLCHGDSGGALWDRHGRLVGVLTGTSRQHGYATPWGER
jgi:hypothetical protein